MTMSLSIFSNMVQRVVSEELEKSDVQIIQCSSNTSKATGANVTEVAYSISALLPDGREQCGQQGATGKREASATNFLELFYLFVLAVPNSPRYVGCNGTAVAIPTFSNPL